MTILLVNIDVDDLDRAIHFYTGAFDLRIGRRFGAAGVELLGANAAIYLLVKQAASVPFPGSTSPRSYGRHWTPVHLDFVVEDLDGALARAEAAGAVRESDVAAHAWGRIVVLADPFGHGLCLIQFSEKGYDAIATNP
ncbi:VOC family protein [Polyangium sp. y55x31]|uniref:VOC family protein n=1 Tax=Polyangium sp. y55x31 TaxID=3042688 RepID=UPI002482FA83|nr:VOC family protein [Polyangium sp. y55x31]MDI1483373.1 VOC family protein [Polyangium sp. y55x31]